MLMNRKGHTHRCGVSFCFWVDDQQQREVSIRAVSAHAHGIISHHICSVVSSSSCSCRRLVDILLLHIARVRSHVREFVFRSVMPRSNREHLGTSHNSVRTTFSHESCRNSKVSNLVRANSYRESPTICFHMFDYQGMLGQITSTFLFCITTDLIGRLNQKNKTHSMNHAGDTHPMKMGVFLDAFR